LGVGRHLFTGARALQREHPRLFAVLLAWPDQQQAEGLVVTYGNYGGRPQKVCRTSRWDLASRLSPEAFVRLYLSSSKTMTPALCALPDLMLDRAGAMNGELQSAFVCCGRNKYHPKPSAFFPGIKASLDPQIIQHGLELNVAFLTELASASRGAQSEFMTRWVKDSPDWAREWIALPAWQRELHHRCTATFSLTNPTKNKPCTVDPEAHQIWDSFKYLRGQLLGTTDLRGLAPRRRQAEHPQTVGTFFQHFAKFTFKEPSRWYEVFWNFGYLLAHSKDGGDMFAKAPWEKRA